MNYPDLPISRYRREIVDAIARHQVVIVVGETGSGKTTQLAKMAVEAYSRDKGTVSSAQCPSQSPSQSPSSPAQSSSSRSRLPSPASSLRKVGCTQPRRLAAVSVARRVAEELGETLGQTVGYQVRFDECLSAETRIKFMTDGILLAETQSDDRLRDYHTLIIDEAHERSLNIDFLLGFLKLLLERRKDLRLVISSATMDVDSFTAFFKDAPVIHVEGRTYPVDIVHMEPRDNEELPYHIVRAVDWLTSLDKKGDVLVFLPGEREIRETFDILDGKNYAQTEILPLFARMGLSEQQKIFSPSRSTRRIILATNVAETSLTIPGIIYVVDSGLVRMSRYSPARQVQRLMLEDTSQASARQRAGRCGRITEGVCVRLYNEKDFLDRKPFTDPEIKRSSLAAVLLRMKSLGLPEMSDFPLPDPPSQKLVTEGYRTLRELGALDKERNLTPLGESMARLPLDPQLSRMLLEAERLKCVSELLVIVSGLGIMDVRERPTDFAQQADAAQRQWNHPQSDFLAMLALWRDTHAALNPNKGNGNAKGTGKSRNALRKFCSKHYLNFLRVLEWHNLIDDLSRFLRETLKRTLPPLPLSEKDTAPYPAIHKAILSGIPRQFGLRHPETKDYKSAQGQNFSIFPGSGLFSLKKRPDWIMGVELVETSRLWMRRCAVLDPAWIEDVAPHLCESRYTHPHWDKSQGAVYALERVLCGGLTIVDRRRVHFGRLFPDEARTIFIRDGLLGSPDDESEDTSLGGSVPFPSSSHSSSNALVASTTTSPSGSKYTTRAWDHPSDRGLKSPPLFLKKLEALKESVLDAEVKWRKPGQLWCEDGAFRKLDAFLPRDCYTEKAFHHFLHRQQTTLKTEASKNNFSKTETAKPIASKQSHPSHSSPISFELSDVTFALWNDYRADDFPDEITLGSLDIPVYYAYSPGEDDDGVTFGIHIDQLDQIPDILSSWGVPGQYAPRAECLMRTLPQALRNGLFPLAQRAEEFAESYRTSLPDILKQELSFTRALTRFVSTLTGQPCYEDQWDSSRIPRELRPKFWVCDDKHRELGMSDNLSALRTKLAPLARKRLERQADNHWSLTGLTTWSCDTLPSSIELAAKPAYPALVDEGTTVGVKAFLSLEQADYAHRFGCLRLALLNHAEQCNHLRKRLPLDVEDKLLLPVFGKTPASNVEDLILLSVEGGLGIKLPRSAKEFDEAGYRLKQNLFPSAQVVCKTWKDLTSTIAQVKTAIITYEAQKFGAPIAQDLRFIMDEWLDTHALLRIGYYKLPDLVRYLKGIRLRLEKIPQQALNRELERIEKIAVFRDPYLQLMAKVEASRPDMRSRISSPSRTWANLEEFSLMLNEYRLTLFSPGVPVKGKISEKRLAEAWESLTRQIDLD